MSSKVAALAKTAGGLPDVSMMNQEQFEKFLATFQQSFPAPLNKDYGYSIIVLSHGFVYIGDITMVGEELTIGRALNIRQWGTSKGLGQLAVEGPQKDTVLDRCGTIYVPKLAVIHIMSVAKNAHDKWQKHPQLVGHI